MALNLLASALFIFFPLSIVVGVFFSNLFLSLLALYGLFISLKKKNRYIYNNIFVRFFILFYVYILIRSLYSVDPLLSLESSLLYIRFIYFALAIYFVLNFKQKNLKYFGVSLILTLLIVTLDALVQFYFGKNIFGWMQEDPYRVSGFFREELVLGSFISRLLPLAFVFIYLFFKNDNIIKKFSIYIFFILLSVGIFLSGERTAFFYLILIIFSFLVLTPNLRIYCFNILFTFFAIGTLLYLTNPEFKNRMFNETIKQMNVQSGLENVKIFSEHHERIYFSAYKMFQSNLFFGHGPKTFRKLCSLPEYNPGACSTHPHNTYLQILAELGFIGAFFVTSFFIYILYQLFVILRNIYFRKEFQVEEIKTALLICLLISLWPLSPSANFFSSWINNFYYLPFGIYLYYIHKKV